MAGNIPGTKYSTHDFLSKFGSIAQSSQYRAHIVWPPGVKSFLSASGINTEILNEMGMLCKATSIPGSSIATHDISNDFYGVTQKHAYKRAYDGTIDLTFFIDSNYQALYAFEGWMEYILPLQGDNSTSSNTYYKASYPENYRNSLFLYKFNKDNAGIAGFTNVRGDTRPATYYNLQSPGEITYTFINAFPQNISSTQVSYDPSANLEFTVTFAYERYVTDKTGVRRTPAASSRTSGNQALKATASIGENPSAGGGRAGANSNWQSTEGEKVSGTDSITGVSRGGDSINRETDVTDMKNAAIKGQNVTINAKGQRGGTGATAGDQALSKARAKSG